MGRAIDEAKESTPRTPLRASTVLGPRGSICFRGVPNWNDSKEAKESICENEAEGAQRRPSAKRALLMTNTLS